VASPRATRKPNCAASKGEMILIETDEVELSRPGAADPSALAALCDPRAAATASCWGATSIEAEDTGVSVRSALETVGRGLLPCIRPSPEGAHRRIRLPACVRPTRTICRASRFTTTRSRSTDFIVTASCWRRRWRKLTLGYVERGRDRQRGDAMRVTVNGEQTGDRRIKRRRACCPKLEYEGTHFAIALNFDVLPRQPLGRKRRSGTATRSRIITAAAGEGEDD